MKPDLVVPALVKITFKFMFKKPAMGFFFAIALNFKTKSLNLHFYKENH